MKKIFLLVFVSMFVITSTVMALAQSNSGSIWTTNADCGNKTQNENAYDVDGKVFINGKNFNAGTYNWDITGNPSSNDPNLMVANGTYAVNASGGFCFEAYTVLIDDDGVYGVDFNGKKDNYHIFKNIPVVPEFGLIAGLATILSSVGLFFFIRKR